MSEQLDSQEIKSGLEKLAHVETKSSSSVKPVFKCQDCETTEDISSEILVKMDNDMPFEAPTHHDKPMSIGVVQ